MYLSEKITYSTVRISCDYKNGSAGVGTGFIMDLWRDTRNNISFPFVVTNKHVVKNSVKCTFELCKADADGNPIDRESYAVALTDDLWIQHPCEDVDLCCFPIWEILNDLVEKGMKPYYIPLQTDLIPNQDVLNDLYAMEDICMVGYPDGLYDVVNHKPIIRRGTTATHAKNDYNGKKQFLIDCACFNGSSGSPVFICNEMPYATLTAGDRIILLGVLFSGPMFTVDGEITFSNIPVEPVAKTNIPMNLGCVIKASEILVLRDEFLSKIKEGNLNL